VRQAWYGNCTLGGLAYLTRLSACGVCSVDTPFPFVAMSASGQRLHEDLTLMQRGGGRLETDFRALERRSDAVTADVPRACVGFVLGAKGATLRDMETRHRTFMFFNNEMVTRTYLFKSPLSHVVPQGGGGVGAR